MIFYFETVAESNIRTKSKCSIQSLQFWSLMLVACYLTIYSSCTNMPVNVLFLTSK